MKVKLISNIVKWIVAAFFGSTILAVVAYRFIPVYFTPLMFIRCIQQAGSGESLKMKHHWEPMEDISQHLPVAVMASEDQRFLLHHGFDVDAIEKAAMHNTRGHKRMHGASTISQQTAKNVFLWPGRSWVRKGFEAYFTVLIEFMWSKQRIMEVYLNSIEMGDGIYGAQAVAEQHFGVNANPRKFDSGHPSGYMFKRQRQILDNMRFIPSFPKEGQDVDPETTVGGVYHKKK